MIVHDKKFSGLQTFCIQTLAPAVQQIECPPLSALSGAWKPGTIAASGFVMDKPGKKKMMM